MANAGVPPDLWLVFLSRVSPRSFLVCPWPFSLSFMPTASTENAYITVSHRVCVRQASRKGACFAAMGERGDALRLGQRWEKEERTKIAEREKRENMKQARLAGPEREKRNKTINGMI